MLLNICASVLLNNIMEEMEADAISIPSPHVPAVENEMGRFLFKNPSKEIGFQKEVENKSVFKFKLQKILSCSICFELRRSAMYQCKHGHLICAGCFGDILYKSKLKNEMSLCPNCKANISKEICSRNVAVEKTISELPRTCPFCTISIPPENYNAHKATLCPKRSAVCSNRQVGCPWEGPFDMKDEHEGKCTQLSASGHDILDSLEVLDKESKEEVDVCDKIFDLLSVGKFIYQDLQFFRCPGQRGNLSFKTTEFSAFDNLWIVRGHFTNQSSEFQYHLSCQTKMCSPLSMNFVLVKGPYSEMDIKPKLIYFQFNEKVTENPLETLSLWYNSDSIRSQFQSYRVNFRIFIFANL